MQWPIGLRWESAATRLLGFLVRFPPYDLISARVRIRWTWLLFKDSARTASSKANLHTVRSSAFSFNIQCLLVPLMSSSSCLRLLLLLRRFPVSAIQSCTSPSIKCLIRKLLRNKWPLQSTFLRFNACRMPLYYFALFNTSSLLTRSVQLIFSILLQHHILKLLPCL
jgi:hypothetical protein